MQETLVNANKEGQDGGAAILTKLGDYVEVRYNDKKKLVEFYRENRYLGSLRSEQKKEGYAKVIRKERLIRGYHFTLEFYQGMTREEGEIKQELHEKRQQEIIEEIKAENLKREQDRQAKLYPPKEPITDDKVINSHSFRNLVSRFYLVTNGKGTFEPTFISIISTFFGDTTQNVEEKNREWWKKHLPNIDNTEIEEYCHQLNENDRLLSLVTRCRADMIRVKEQQWNERERYISRGYTRHTHCWRCRTRLNSQSHNKCSRCNWLICSCGACQQGCSGH
ncbi:hypothetical protein [Bacillus suaedaesalsae]|uniref:Uncharacterized protein n=1 Tax=Bacillus suaedaesalsae TaxID=2810349 RepID=A0ABS2DCY6_9BACI|nr:hypothetical protein [Bacillus suaedaesalsae]MBM6616321.1 hypothetical protein [Bacillus suaedaesalsae]